MTAPIEISWAEPTEAQLAALAHVYRFQGKKVPALPAAITHQDLVNLHKTTATWAVHQDAAHLYPDMTAYDLAEIMLTSKGSLWCLEAFAWSNGQTPYADSYGIAVAPIFQTAGRWLCEIVQRGFENGKWWDVKALWPKPEELGIALLQIVEVARQLDYFKRNLAQPEVHSVVFQFLPHLLIPRFDRRRAFGLMGEQDGAILVCAEIQAEFFPEVAKVLRRERREADKILAASYLPAKCLQPDCARLIPPPGIPPREGHAPNWQKKNVCCRAHEGYQCGHSDCIASAKAQNLKYLLHRWGTQIAAQHVEHRVSTEKGQ